MMFHPQRPTGLSYSGLKFEAHIQLICQLIVPLQHEKPDNIVIFNSKRGLIHADLLHGETVPPEYLPYQFA